MNLREKLDLLRRTEAEHHFGVIIEESTNPEPVPDLPPAVTEVFTLFSRLGGDNFRFLQPSDIATPATWAERHIDPYCPLGNPLRIGCERHGAPADIECGSGIYLDLEDGDVYFCDGDDYVHAYENTDLETVETTELAPDIATFFDHHVLGAGYPRLVTATIGDHALHRPDNWRKLLHHSGLLD
ncbi:hypothetical protein [Actinomadura verrucosospora]|uniref:SMI1/KNR4 family protein n=1 Tax=Actinomadura verrucosospora TaxID=46165 RepID=A0A7D4ASA2_ACTVE|nr:hypothetical protein [Actinomadura verrucosospora]QKG23869.1 hypothetical protein ACTIVE_5512 [Actinomadura verrucosospora]